MARQRGRGAGGAGRSRGHLGAEPVLTPRIPWDISQAVGPHPVSTCSSVGRVVALRPRGFEWARGPCEFASLSQSLCAPFPALQRGRSPTLPAKQMQSRWRGSKPPLRCPPKQLGTPQRWGAGRWKRARFLLALTGQSCRCYCGACLGVDGAVGHPLAFPSLAPRASVWVGWGRPCAALSRALDKLIKTPRDLSRVDQPCSVPCLPKGTRIPSQMPAAGCYRVTGMAAAL